MGTISDQRGAGARRIAFYAAAALALQVLFLAIWAVRYYALHDYNAPMVGLDFAVFWSAARVALEHGAASVFSPEWMQPLEAAIRPEFQYTPFPYPPTFLFAIAFFGAIPFGAALIAFLSCGLAAYGAMITRLVSRLDSAIYLAVVAFPGAAVAIFFGQNSLFTAAAAGGALMLLEGNSMLAGVCIAALAIKPQLAVLFPLALICERRWKAFAVAAAGTIALVGASALAFGHGAWTAFFAYLPEFSRLMTEQRSTWGWMPTVFAACRLAGSSIGTAYLVQALVAVPAVALMAYLWIRRARIELRASALVIATLLVQPYLMYYDLVWLVIPIAFLIRDARARDLWPVEWGILGAAWLMPVQGFLAIMLGVPVQLAPLVLIALLVMVVRRPLALA